MSQPTLLAIEISRLKLKRQNHRRNVEVTRGPQQCRADVARNHDSLPFHIQGFPSREIGKRASGLNSEVLVFSLANVSGRFRRVMPTAAGCGIVAR